MTPGTVVLLLSNTAGSIGGTQRQAELLATELAARGLDVVLASKGRGLLPVSSRVSGRGLQRLELPTLRRLPAWSLLVSLLVWATAHRQRIAVFHAQSTSAGIIAGIAGRVLGKPVVVKVTEMKYAHGLADRSAARRLRRWMLARTASVVVALSTEMRQALAAAGLADRIVVIPNGVALPPRRSVVSPRVPGQGFGDDASAVVLCVGRLTPRKRVDALLAAWPAVDRSRAVLLIVGDGPLRTRLQADAAARGLERVRFLGMRDDVAALYQSADVFVLPSASEGMSNALLEAMAAGLTVVAADIGANREIVDDGVSGFLVDWSDTAACAHLLRRLIDDPGLRRRVGQAAAQRARSFAIGVVTDRYCALYGSLHGAPLTAAAPGHRSG